MRNDPGEQGFMETVQLLQDGQGIGLFCTWGLTSCALQKVSSTSILISLSLTRQNICCSRVQAAPYVWGSSYRSRPHNRTARDNWQDIFSESFGELTNWRLCWGTRCPQVYWRLRVV